MIKEPKRWIKPKNLHETERLWSVSNKIVTKNNNEKRNLPVIVQNRKHVTKIYLENNTIGNCWKAAILMNGNLLSKFAS